MRFFNREGPIKPEKHYCIPPLSRFDLAEIELLIQQEKYFILHAPRQVGKTSYLLALMDYLNQDGHYKCLYINVEGGQAEREDIVKAQKIILQEMAVRSELYLEDDFLSQHLPELCSAPSMLNTALTL